MGRMTNWAEAGSAATPAASIAYAYDAAGNVRRTTAQYRVLDAQGAGSATSTPQDYWYRYDAMNRIVTAKGALSGGVIARGATGTDLSYNAAGQRATATTTVNKRFLVEYAADQFQYEYHLVDQREDHGYGAGGELATVGIATGSYEGLGYTAPAGAATLRAQYTRDLMGRVTRQLEYQEGGTTVAYDRTAAYNSKSQVTSDDASTKRGSDTYRGVSSQKNGDTQKNGKNGDTVLISR